MDVEKILDFHRLLMLTSDGHSEEDETSCGPLCQHPACWESNRRRERGIPRLSQEKPGQDDSEADLPTVKFYNMLDDYGSSTEDVLPASGSYPEQNPSPPRDDFTPYFQSDSLSPPQPHYPSPAGGCRSSKAVSLHPVEVQEVFDTDDLNGGWDETFLTQQYLVWVPNPHKRKNEASHVDTLAVTEKEHDSQPKMIKATDMTEAMVPLTVKLQREKTVLLTHNIGPPSNKKQNRAGSPIFRHVSFALTEASLLGSKPDIDSEGVRELLGLPRDILMQVLDRTKKSDFMSQEKIHTIVEEVLETSRGGRVSPRTALSKAAQRSIPYFKTDDVLLQQKLPLHYSKQRAVRRSQPLDQRPVFQLDDDLLVRSASVDTSQRGSDLGYTQRPSLSKYPETLPPILAEDLGEGDDLGLQVTGVKANRMKMASVSLGLPELPSGLRQTRPFVYNAPYRPDLTLMPVPTPPCSQRSSPSRASEHGTTLRVNLPSVSDSGEDQLRQLAVPRMTKDGGVHRETTPLYIPAAPVGTPVTVHTPSKPSRDHTSSSLRGAGDRASLSQPREAAAKSSFTEFNLSSVPLNTVGTGSKRKAAKEQVGPLQVTLPALQPSPCHPPCSPQIDSDEPPSPEWPRVNESSFYFPKGLPPKPTPKPSKLAKNDSGDDSGFDWLANAAVDVKVSVNLPAPAPPPPSPDLTQKRMKKKVKERSSSKGSSAGETSQISAESSSVSLISRTRGSTSSEGDKDIDAKSPATLRNKKERSKSRDKGGVVSSKQQATSKNVKRGSASVETEKAKKSQAPSKNKKDKPVSRNAGQDLAKKPHAVLKYRSASRDPDQDNKLQTTLKDESLNTGIDQDLAGKPHTALEDRQVHKDIDQDPADKPLTKDTHENRVVDLDLADNQQASLADNKDRPISNEGRASQRGRSRLVQKKRGSPEAQRLVTVAKFGPDDTSMTVTSLSPCRSSSGKKRHQTFVTVDIPSDPTGGEGEGASAPHPSPHTGRSSGQDRESPGSDVSADKSKEEEKCKGDASSTLRQDWL